MIRLLFIPILFLGMLLSCKKENNKKWTELDIDVQNVYSGEAVNDIQFYVYGKNPKNENRTHQVGEGFPINGFIHFEFKARSGYEYSISEIDYGSYSIIAVDGAPFQMGEKNALHYKVSPHRKFRLTIENVNCFTSTDTLHWKLTYLNHPGFETYDYYWEEGSWDGCYPKVEAFNQNMPAGKYALEWIVSRENGNSANGIDTLFVPLSGGLSYDFQY